MEFFSKSKVVKLRSHLDKYLISDDSIGKVRQSRKGSNRRSSNWTVETLENNDNVIRLRSWNGKYLTASETPFMLGVTGKRVTLTESVSEGKKLEWEPIRDGFEVKLRSWCGKYLRANGGTPPWRNTVTHDEPHSSTTKDWVLWDVEPVLEEVDGFSEKSTSVFSSSFASDDVFGGSDPPSPMSVFSITSPPARGNYQLQFWCGTGNSKFMDSSDNFVDCGSVHGESIEVDNNDDDNASWEPVTGMCFSCIDEAKTFYGEYASRKGFGWKIRTSNKGDDGNLCYLILACSRGGSPVSTIPCTLKTLPTKKQNCPAKIIIKLGEEDGLWYVTKFEPNHSHEVSPTKSRLFKANKKINLHVKRTIQINDEAGVRINKTFQSLVNAF